MPRTDATSHGYYNASPECWSVYTEVLAAEYGNAVLFGQVHQLTVDTYAVQHAGGEHPDKSVDVHLCGLYLVFEEKLAPTSVPPVLQRLATQIKDWPHFEPPPRVEEVTVFDVAMSDGPLQHIEVVRRWATAVWNAWTRHRAAVGVLASSR